MSDWLGLSVVSDGGGVSDWLGLLSLTEVVCLAGQAEVSAITCCTSSSPAR